MSKIVERLVKSDVHLRKENHHGVHPVMFEMPSANREWARKYTFVQTFRVRLVRISTREGALIRSIVCSSLVTFSPLSHFSPSLLLQCPVCGEECQAESLLNLSSTVCDFVVPPTVAIKQAITSLNIKRLPYRNRYSGYNVPRPPIKRSDLLGN